jgi:hypothetical protein
MTLDGIPVADIGSSALIAFFVLLVFTGRLVTLRELRDTQKERDHWRQAAEQRSAQLSELLAATHTSTAFIEATVKAAQVER